MRQVSAEEVKQACIAANINHIPHHDCGGCGCWVAYQRQGENLYFNSNCGCSSFESGPRPCNWYEAADWINMQSKPEIKVELAKRFGLTLET